MQYLKKINKNIFQCLFTCVRVLSKAKCDLVGGKLATAPFGSSTFTSCSYLVDPFTVREHRCSVNFWFSTWAKQLNFPPIVLIDNRKINLWKHHLHNVLCSPQLAHFQFRQRINVNYQAVAPHQKSVTKSINLRSVQTGESNRNLKFSASIIWRLAKPDYKLPSGFRWTWKFMRIYHLDFIDD